MELFDFGDKVSFALFVCCLLIFKAVHEVSIVEIFIGIDLMSMVLTCLKVLNSPNKITDGLQLHSEDRLVNLSWSKKLILVFVRFDWLEFGFELVTLAIAGVKEACSERNYGGIKALFGIGLTISRKDVLTNLFVFNEDGSFVD